MTIADSITRSSGFAVAEESVAGTAEVTPDLYEYLTDDPNINPTANTMIFRSLLSRTALNAANVGYQTGGTITTIADPDSILGYILKWTLGDSSSAVQGGTSAYKHTFTAEDTIPSFTSWFNRGTALKTKIPYCVISSLTLSQSVEDALRISAPFIGQKEVVATDFGTASYSHVIPFTNPNLTVSIDGSPATGAHNTSLTIDNGIDTTLGKVHGSMFYTAIVPGARSITGSISLYFDTATEYKRYWGSTTATQPTANVDSVPIILTWDLGIEAGTGYNYKLIITLPSVIYTTTNVSLSGTRMVQTINFEAMYDTVTAKDIQIELTNKITTY